MRVILGDVDTRGSGRKVYSCELQLMSKRQTAAARARMGLTRPKISDRSESARRLQERVTSYHKC
jgi:hypothetical protein